MEKEKTSPTKPVLDQEKNQDKITAFKQFIDIHKDEDGALIPVLQECQRLFSYIPEELLLDMTRNLNVSPGNIYEVVSFYPQFSLQPTGKNRIQVCTSVSSYLKGGEEVLHAFAHSLGIDPGQSTEDGLFTLEELACGGEYKNGPLVFINGEKHEEVRPDQVEELLNQYR